MKTEREIKDKINALRQTSKRYFNVGNDHLYYTTTQKIKLLKWILGKDAVDRRKTKKRFI